jgi:hypothetical protein
MRLMKVTFGHKKNSPSKVSLKDNCLFYGRYLPVFMDDF